MYDWESTKSPWYNNGTIQTVSLPDGLTHIGDYAFLYCTAISSINIPDTVTSIGESSFYLCTSITSLDIPEKLTSIGKSSIRQFKTM